MRERSIGIGELGFHAYLQKKGVPFESVVAKSINNRISKHIETKLNEANYELGILRGEAPDIQSLVTVSTDSGWTSDRVSNIDFDSSSFVSITRDGKEKSVRGFALVEGDVLTRPANAKITKVEKKEWAGRRFSHMRAIAPNASSSILMGNTSPSIEPYRANAYRQDTLSGSYLNKNRFLDAIIKKEAESHSDGWYQETWSSIIANDGSVQHLDWLSDHDKEVFKTAPEIDQRWVIEHAADRQMRIDQAQSVNIFFRPDVNIKYLHAVHFLAWKKKLKTLYYCRSEKIGKADKVAKKVEREIIKEINMKSLINDSDCLACEG